MPRPHRSAFSHNNRRPPVRRVPLENNFKMLCQLGFVLLPSSGQGRTVYKPCGPLPLNSRKRVLAFFTGKGPGLFCMPMFNSLAGKLQYIYMNLLCNKQHMQDVHSPECRSSARPFQPDAGRRHSSFQHLHCGIFSQLSA